MPANIILFICDDMQFEQLQRCPRIMGIQSGGVFFANAFTAVPICQPARVVFMTGQYPHNNGIETNEASVLGLDYTTMVPRRLQLAGYQTAHYGKWFNQWHATDPVPVGWSEFHAFEPQNYSDYNINDNGVVTPHVMEYYTDRLTKMVTTYIAGAPQPFFLQVGQKAPHFQTSSLTGIAAPAYAGCGGTTKQFPRNANWNAMQASKPNHMKALVPINSTIEAQIDQFWRTETEELFSLDASVSAILNALAGSGKTNTYVFITSDNGYMHGEHRLPSQKGFPYEPCIHIPLVVKVPGMSGSGYSTRLVSHVDLAATWYEISGATSTRALDGKSLLNILQNPNGAPKLHDHVFFESKDVVLGAPPAPPPPPNYKGVRTLYDVYIEYTTGEKELYDISADPWQINNVAGVPGYATTQADRAAALTAFRTCSGAGCDI